MSGTAGAGAGDGGAGTGTGAGAGTGASTPPAWTETLGDELKGYVTTKGFKEPKDVVESYRNFEKLQGVPKERLLTLPESLEGSGMDPIWERLGAVKEPKEYQIEIPKEYGDEKLGDFLKETFHKLKVPRSMAEGFAKAFNERQKTALHEVTENTKLDIKNQHESVKKEWGAAFEQNQNIAAAATKKFGLTEADVKSLGASMGPAKALKFLYELGKGLGEGTFINGDGAGGGKSTPEQARNEIKELMKDSDFSRRLSSGDTDAKNKWNRLHQEAYPG